MSTDGHLPAKSQRLPVKSGVFSFIFCFHSFFSCLDFSHFLFCCFYFFHFLLFFVFFLLSLFFFVCVIFLFRFFCFSCFVFVCVDFSIFVLKKIIFAATQTRPAQPNTPPPNHRNTQHPTHPPNPTPDAQPNTPSLSVLLVSSSCQCNHKTPKRDTWPLCIWINGVL